MNDLHRPASTGRPRRLGHIAMATTVAMLGFLLVTQFRAQQGLTDRLKVERESDLGRILSELGARNDRLEEEIIDLRVRLAESSGSESQRRALLDEARARLDALQILLGATPVKGSGIVVTLADPDGTVGPDVLLDAVQELRDAGAEAIAVGGVRVVASTAFTGQAGALRVGNRLLAPPYELLAIGAPQTLVEALRIPGGFIDALAARGGASARVVQSGAVSILSVSPIPRFTYARPNPRR